MPAHSCLRSLRGLSQGDFREIVGGNDAAPAGSVRLSLLIPARESVPALRENVRQAHDFLLQRLGTGFEIILIPNPPPGADAAASIRACAEAAGILPRVKVVAHLTPPMSPGKGAALRTGYAMSVGRTIFFTDADLPFDLDFIDAALEKIDE
ncbi:MAG TPA: hypothetical protein VH309_08135, partial [Elusimicrobiota bacterium]|nr:hypothetical protein [Elusimicrobiota bacterium]